MSKQKKSSFSTLFPKALSPFLREGWILGLTLIVIAALCFIAIPSWSDALGNRRAPVREHNATVALAIPPAKTQSATRNTLPDWQEITVRPKQTLSDIFSSRGIKYTTLMKVIEASKQSDALHYLHPGDTLGFLQGEKGKLLAFRYDKNPTHRVVLHFDGSTPTRTVSTRSVAHRQQFAQGTIKSSLFQAASDAGINEAMVIKLADVFKYDIDFIKDLRKGDHFTVIYDSIYRKGELLHTGDILAAEFYNQGKRYTAYRFKKSNGHTAYFTEDGRPLRKSLLRTPVKFTRISSRFTKARKHPILGYTRAHKGVDYAAPKGTAIHAAGDGVISIHGWVKGFGRYIRIKHNNTYSTAYAHMSGFAKGLKRGSHVHQGQVIGYVGMTGLATGPHLHYEVLVHGTQVNPLKVTLPKPKPMKRALLAQFKQHISPFLAQMRYLDHHLELAKAKSRSKKSAKPAG